MDPKIANAGPIVLVDGRTIGDHYPGIGRYAYHLADALASAAPDWEFRLLHNPNEPNSRFDVTGLADSHPNLALLHCPLSPFALSQQWRVPGTIRGLGRRPALYHSPYYLMPYRSGLPSVVTTHDLIPLLYPGYFSLRERLLFRLTTWMALRCVGQVIAVSSQTKNDLQRYFHLPDERISVIPEAPGSLFRPPASPALAATRRRYNLPARYALYFGSNKPHKNLVRLIDAWATVAGRDPDVSAGRCPLVIGGHWDARYPEARDRAEALELGQRVRFIGPVAEEDLPALYGGATLFVFPSLYEGFGLPLLEAMACGTPVVCSDRSSLPEVAGDAALLVDPVDVAALADALLRLLEDTALREHLTERAIARAATFSWERAARETLEVYGRLLTCSSRTI